LYKQGKFKPSFIYFDKLRKQNKRQAGLLASKGWQEECQVGASVACPGGCVSLPPAPIKRI